MWVVGGVCGRVMRNGKGGERAGMGGRTGGGKSEERGWAWCKVGELERGVGLGCFFEQSTWIGICSSDSCVAQPTS